MDYFGMKYWKTSIYPTLLISYLRKILLIIGFYRHIEEEGLLLRL